MSSPISINQVTKALSVKAFEIRLNVLYNELDIRGLPSAYSKENAYNTLLVLVTDCLKAHKVANVSSDRVTSILAAIADENRFNPIKDLLESATWDGTTRLPVLFEILGVMEAKPQTYIEKWMIQTVALGLNDEENPVSAEGVLVLQGPQGIAKTSVFRKLMCFNPRFFVEGAVIDVNNKDSLLNATSGWVCELGELDSTIRKEQSALKAFISQPYDKIRTPYARTATRRPRRTSFCGTVNPKEYLRDETGSRRFWTVPVTKIDKAALFALTEDWILQLWLEVYSMYKNDPNGFRLTDDEMAALQANNQDFEVPLPYEEEIREAIDFGLPASKWRWWKSTQVLQAVSCNANTAQVGKILTKIMKEEQASGRWAAPNPVPAMKKVNGSTQYFLPVLHPIVRN